MDIEYGSKPGSGGTATSENEAINRRERLRRLALETIDLAKDPYFMRNHLGRALPKDANPGGAGRSSGGGSGGGGGGFSGYGGSGGSQSSYDSRGDSNRYMQAQGVGGGFPSYASASYNANGFGYGPGSNGMAYGGYAGYGVASGS